MDCLNRRKLRALGLLEDQLLTPEVVVGCANESPAGVLGVFFGKVTAMEGLRKLQVQVMFYVLRDGGNILSRHTCEKLGVISSEFPKVGEHLLEAAHDVENQGVEVNVESGEEGGRHVVHRDESFSSFPVILPGMANLDLHPDRHLGIG